MSSGWCEDDSKSRGFQHSQGCIATTAVQLSLSAMLPLGYLRPMYSAPVPTNVREVAALHLVMDIRRLGWRVRFVPLGDTCQDIQR